MPYNAQVLTTQDQATVTQPNVLGLADLCAVTCSCPVAVMTLYITSFMFISQLSLLMLSAVCCRACKILGTWTPPK